MTTPFLPMPATSFVGRREELANIAALTLDPLPVIPLQLLITEQRVIGSVIGSRLDLQELLQRAVQNNIRPITESYTLDDVNKAHQRLRASTVRYRAVLTPN